MCRQTPNEHAGDVLGNAACVLRMPIRPVMLFLAAGA
jgi:hypothetical protein